MLRAVPRLPMGFYVLLTAVALVAAGTELLFIFTTTTSAVGTGVQGQDLHDGRLQVGPRVAPHSLRMGEVAPPQQPQQSQAPVPALSSSSTPPLAPVGGNAGSLWDEGADQGEPGGGGVPSSSPSSSVLPPAPSPLSLTPGAARAVPPRPGRGQLLDLTALPAFEEGRALRAEAVDPSSTASFVATGGRLPILLVTKDRPRYLQHTLTTLLSARGVTADDIMVVMDGADDATVRLLDGFGIRTHRSPATHLRGDGAQRIARHYGVALGWALTDGCPQCPGVIVVEDDFLFGPDMYEWFHAAAVTVEADPSLWLASSWNDNGNRWLLRDARAVRRTRYFPGLGWYLPRRLWTDELAGRWPTQHWDHWMRDKQRHKGRDVLHPEVPRGYHIGLKGTFMDWTTHNHYFRYVGMAADTAVRWIGPEARATLQNLRAAMQPRYGERMREALGRAQLLTSPVAAANLEAGEGLLVHGASPAGDNADFRRIAPFFGIWHEPERAAEDRLHVVRWRGGSTLYLVHRDSAWLRGVRSVQRGEVVPSGMFQNTQRPADVDAPPSLHVVSPLEDEAKAKEFTAGKPLIRLMPCDACSWAQEGHLVDLPWLRAAPESAAGRFAPARDAGAGMRVGASGWE